MTPSVLSASGLAADILGAGILFLQSLYFEQRLPTNGGIVLHDANAPLARKGKLAAKLSKLGLGLLLIGFVLQLIGNLI